MSVVVPAVRSCLAVVVSLVLVVTLVTPASAGEESAQADPDLSVVLPAPESTPAEVPAPQLPSGDFSTGEVSRGPKLFRVATKVRMEPLDLSKLDIESLQVVSRDEFSTVYSLGDGRRLAALSDAPSNVRSEGSWVPIDTRMERVVGGWRVEDHPMSPVFSQRAGGEVVTVSSGDAELSWRLLGAADARGSVATYRDGTQHPLTFRGVLPGVDLQYSVVPTGVKEALLLSAAPASAPEYRWLLSAPGLMVEPDGMGGFVVRDVGGEVRFTIAPPVMWDSAGVEGVRESEFMAVSSTIERVGEDWVLAMRPDFEWLTDPSRVYPVTVDPTTWLGPTYAWSYKSDGTFANGTAYIGNPWQANRSLYWRSFARYPLQNIAGYYVADSVLGFAYLGGTATCQWEWVGASGTTNPTGVGSYGVDVSSFTMCNTTAYASDATLDTLDSTIAQMVRTGQYYNFISFRAYAEANVGYSYKSLASQLYVVYHAYPSVTSVTGATPTGGQTGSRAPKMNAVVSADPGTGPKVKYQFEKTGGTGNGGGGAWSPTSIAYETEWVNPGEFQIPSNVLESNTQYRYRIWAKDGYNGHLGN